MKILLASLMCGLLTTLQCFAIDGGPWGPGGGVTVTGNYAGVMVPIPVAPDPANPGATLPPDNSIALFTISIPTIGLASGTSATFRNGIAYSGTFIGSADPDTQKLTGILTSQFFVFSDVTIGTTTTSVTIAAEYDANGKLENAKIVANTHASSAAARIRGTASITYTNQQFLSGVDDPNGDSGGPILYRVIGFKQSEATS